MLELLETLSGTPIPTILVVAGILFLLLSFSGGLSGKLTIPETRQKLAGFTGALLLGLGVLIYVVPSIKPGTAKDDGSDNELLDPLETWEVIGSDTFFSDSSKWSAKEFDNDGGKHQQVIMSGVYRWESHFNQSWWQARYSPYDPVTNFYAATDINFKSNEYDGDFSAGLVFRASYNRMYQLHLAPTKSLKLEYSDTKDKGENDKVLIDWVYLPSMDNAKSNRVAVLAEGNLLKVYFNGKLTGQVEDNSQGFGNVGYFVYSYADGEMAAEVEFDNFELKAPPG